MASALNVVHNTTNQMSAQTALPGAIWGSFSILHKVHSSWHWFRRGKLYTNPDNFVKLSAGHALNFAAGNALPVRVAAQTVLIATRVLDCIEQKSLFSESWQRAVDAIKLRHPVHIKASWKPVAEGTWMSPSSSFFWRTKFTIVMEHSKRIIVCTVRLFKDGFSLSMRFLDAAEAFSLDPAVQREGVSEVFVNSTKWMDRLCENKEELIAGLETNKQVIDKIFTGMHSPYSAELFVHHVSAGIEKTTSAYDQAVRVSQTANGMLVDLVKRSVFGFMTAMGLSKFTPKILVPSLTPDWVAPLQAKHFGRYPPEGWLVKDRLAAEEEYDLGAPVATTPVEQTTRFKYIIPDKVAEKTQAPAEQFEPAAATAAETIPFEPDLYDIVYQPQSTQKPFHIRFDSDNDVIPDEPNLIFKDTTSAPAGLTSAPLKDRRLFVVNSGQVVF